MIPFGCTPGTRLAIRVALVYASRKLTLVDIPLSLSDMLAVMTT